MTTVPRFFQIKAAMLYLREHQPGVRGLVALPGNESGSMLFLHECGADERATGQTLAVVMGQQ